MAGRKEVREERETRDTEGLMGEQRGRHGSNVMVNAWRTPRWLKACLHRDFFFNVTEFKFISHMDNFAKNSGF